MLITVALQTLIPVAPRALQTYETSCRVDPKFGSLCTKVAFAGSNLTERFVPNDRL